MSLTFTSDSNISANEASNCEPLGDRDTASEDKKLQVMCYTCGIRQESIGRN